MVKHRGRQLRNEESGVILIVAALMMIAMLGMVAFVVDFGRAYVAQRQLQAGVDAAALAGAQHLPIADEATTVAYQYGPGPGGKNELTIGTAVEVVATPRCVKAAPGCQQRFNTVNAINVTGRADVPLTFGRLLGMDTFTVRASATACSPCSAKPLDIMIVLDRTGSMCQLGNGQSDPACTDLNNAKDGVRTFLSFMDPTLDAVGLAVFPPAIERNRLCRTPRSDERRYGYDAWWPEWSTTLPPGADPSVYAIASVTMDYLTGTFDTGYTLNPASALIQRLDCVGGAGTTSYSNAIEEAQHELNEHGRGDIDDVIIFLSDGAANTTPRNLPSYMDTAHYRRHPCDAGIRAAAQAKASGTAIYTIGYDLDGQGATPERCRLYPNNLGNDGTTTAWDTIRGMASEPDNFYNKPDPGQLNTIFTRIAADLNKPAARLISDSLT
jgi:type II secretory pathway pseudopilin PulG